LIFRLLATSSIELNLNLNTGSKPTMNIQQNVTYLLTLISFHAHRHIRGIKVSTRCVIWWSSKLPSLMTWRDASKWYRKVFWSWTQIPNSWLSLLIRAYSRYVIRKCLPLQCYPANLLMTACIMNFRQW